MRGGWLDVGGEGCLGVRRKGRSAVRGALKVLPVWGWRGGEICLAGS